MSSKKSLYIVGAGSVGGHIATNMENFTDKYIIEGFIDDDESKIGNIIHGYPVLGNTDYLLKNNHIAVVIGISYPDIKNKIYQKISKNRSLEFPSLISKNAWVSKKVEFGKGCIIYPGTSIDYGTVILDFVTINLNCAIAHDCRVASYTSLAPGANFAGNTKIGKNVKIGIGVSTIQNITIGDNAVIGGQSMIIKDIPEGKIVKGVPGRF